PATDASHGSKRRSTGSRVLWSSTPVTRSTERRFTEPARRAEERTMAKTAGLRIVESDTAPGLGVVRKRAGHLKARAEELRRKVEVARTRDAEMEETLQERRDGLVEGTSSHEDVAAA